MKRTIDRLAALAACQVLMLGLAVAPADVPPASARPADQTRIALLASGHAGTVIAARDEEVAFAALPNRALGAGEAIAIVSIKHKALVDLCVEAPCIGADTSAKARVDVYQAFLLGGQGGSHVVARSNPVQVEWKKLEIRVKFTDSTGTLQTEPPGPDGGELFSELRGVPVSVNVTFPDGLSTAWKTVLMHATPSGVTQGTPGYDPAPCPLPGPCRRKVPALDDYYPYRFSEATENIIHVYVLDQSGAILEAVAPEPRVRYRLWQVTFQATDTHTGQTSDSELKVAPGQTATLNATVTEPKRQALLPYMDRLEIRGTNAQIQNTDGEPLAECKQEFTCRYTVQGDENGETNVFWADVRGLGTNSSGNRPLSGRSNRVTIKPQLNLTITNAITGGTSASCTPYGGSSSAGYTCSLKAGGTAQVTATVKPSLPSGYLIRWTAHESDETWADCTASPCTITVHQPANVQPFNGRVLAHYGAAVLDPQRTVVASDPEGPVEIDWEVP